MSPSAIFVLRRSPAPSFTSLALTAIGLQALSCMSIVVLIWPKGHRQHVGHRLEQLLQHCSWQKEHDTGEYSQYRYLDKVGDQKRYEFRINCLHR